MREFCQCQGFGQAISHETRLSWDCSNTGSSPSSSCLHHLLETPTTSCSSKSLQVNAKTKLTICPSVISYPLAVVNVFVAGALIHLYLHPFSIHRNPTTWAPPFRATLPIAIFFLFSNIYLVVTPFVPPSAGQNVYDHLPYYLHCVVGIGILLAGAVYWLIWAVILPKIGGYELFRESTLMDDGWTRNVFLRSPRTD